MLTGITNLFIPVCTMAKPTASKIPLTPDSKKIQDSVKGLVKPDEQPKASRIRRADQMGLRQAIYVAIIQGDIAAGMLDDLQDLSRSSDKTKAEKLLENKIKNAVNLTDRYVSAFDA